MSLYSATVLNDAPIRYYRLDEPAGPTAVDLGSQASNATYRASGITYNQTPLLPGDKGNPCISLDDSAGYVTIPTTSLPTGVNAFSLEAWTQMHVLDPDTWSVILCYGTQTTNKFVELAFNNSAYFVATANGVNNNSLATATIDTLYHLVITYDGATLLFYANGVQQATQTVTLNITWGHCCIGSEDPAPTQLYGGYVQDVALYNKTLTPAQITAHYAAGIIALPISVWCQNNTCTWAQTCADAGYCMQDAYSYAVTGGGTSHATGNTMTGGVQ